MTTKVMTESEVDKVSFYARDGVLTSHDIKTIHGSCLAKWRYQYDNEEDEVTDKAKLGTAAHSILLSPDKFKAKYYRMPEKSDYESGQLLTSIKAMQSWLKERGVAGRSEDDPVKLSDFIRKQCELTHEPLPFFWHEIEAQAAEIGRNYQMVRGNDYDTVVAMRDVIMSNPSYQHMFKNGEGPFYVVAELAGVPCKTKIEKVVDNMLWDYVTTGDASPENFIRNQGRIGSYIRFAFNYQMFFKAFGKFPEEMIILAQEKELPYIPEHYRISSDALKIGNRQLKDLLSKVKAASSANKWPTYSGGKVLEFAPSEWEKKQYPDLFKEEK